MADPLIRTILAVPADTHCGSTVGLAPDEWVETDGGTRTLSESQRVVRKQWKECWYRIRELNTGSARLIICVNGDTIEGKHHDMSQIVTTSLEEQKRMHVASMLEAMKIARWNDDTDEMYYLQSTFSHGNGIDESIARDYISKKGKYLVVPQTEPTAKNEFQDGRFVRDRLILDINGVVFDIAHHGLSGGVRAWTKENQVYNAMKSLYFYNLDRGLQIPRYVVASHKHEYVTAEYGGRSGTIRGFITPAFQTKTHYGGAVARFKIADIGMLFFVIEKDGSSRFECPRVEQPDVKVEKV